ncbi:unnamed protein product, partial [Sphenostylis stenocarpa]
ERKMIRVKEACPQAMELTHQISVDGDKLGCVPWTSIWANNNKCMLLTSGHVSPVDAVLCD